VRQLIADKIAKLGLERFFTVLDTEIRGENGSNIIFRGMQSHNAETLKSLEGMDIAWIEEAQTLSQHSLDILRPTIRKPDSELWFSWNPRHRTDPVDVFFRKHPPPEAVSVQVNFRDNPWFPRVLRKDMEHDFENDPELAEHIWNGGYEIGHGAILARWIDRAERAGRIHDGVAYDNNGPRVEISCDLGFRDTSTWWFWQRRIGGAAVLDYDRDSGLEASDWIDRLEKRLKDREWPLGRIWLPHDAMAKTIATKHSVVEQFVRKFGSNYVSVIPLSKTQDRINAARTFIKSVEISTRCEVGLDGLRAWEFEWNPETQTFSREPLHNWASHDGDGFSYGCQVMQGMRPPAPEKEPEPMRGIGQITVDEFLKGVSPVRIRV
jgi:phage terminase large subunit